MMYYYYLAVQASEKSPFARFVDIIWELASVLQQWVEGDAM